MNVSESSESNRLRKQARTNIKYKWQKILINLVTGDESLLFLKGKTEAPKLFTSASTYRRLLLTGDVSS